MHASTVLKRIAPTIRIAATSILIFLTLGSSVKAEDEMNAANMISDLTQKVKAIEPTAQEDKWRRIPWRIDLMSARDEAASENKPIFLWLMNGHPMGCT